MPSDDRHERSYDSAMAMREAMMDVRISDRPVEALPFEPFPQPAGGECIFLGRTRAETHEAHGKLVRLSYEAYRPMAEQVLRDLASRAAEQFECLAVRVHHAIGDVPLGEASVLVQVVCGHRGEAFDACRFLINALKEQAPIWKREEWEDGASWSEGQPVQPPAQS